MARTHTFKGSASTGYGYFAYIEDGQLVIGEDWGREGGILYKGPFDCKDAEKHLATLRKNSPKLYESILRYYAKEGAKKEAMKVQVAKAADMKATIDELQEITRTGIDSWTEFGKALDALYKARDEYTNVQHEIVVEAYNT